MKKAITCIVGIVAAISMSIASFSADAFNLEESDLEGYDYRVCESGTYSTMYLKFKTVRSGEFSNISKNYSEVFVTVGEDSALDALSDVLGEEETAYCCQAAENQHVYPYSSDVDYENLYTILGVEKVELAKGITTARFGANLWVPASDPWREESGYDKYAKVDFGTEEEFLQYAKEIEPIREYFATLCMFQVTTEDGVELTPETFADTGYTVEHVSKLDETEWLLYVKYTGTDCYLDFALAAEEIDGIVSLDVPFECEDVASDHVYVFDLVENPALAQPAETTSATEPAEPETTVTTVTIAETTAEPEKTTPAETTLAETETTAAFTEPTSQTESVAVPAAESTVTTASAAQPAEPAVTTAPAEPEEPLPQTGMPWAKAAESLAAGLIIGGAGLVVKSRRKTK